MILCAVVLALTGCAKQEQESTAAAPPPDSGTALQPTEPPLPAPKAEPKPAPESQKPTETTQAPDDFPLPIYEGFTVKNTLRTQTGDFKGMQVEIAGNATPETVAQFYEAEFNKRGLKVSKMTQKTDAGDEVLVLGQSDKITAGIAAAKEQDQTRVILSWSEKK